MLAEVPALECEEAARRVAQMYSQRGAIGRQIGGTCLPGLKMDNVRAFVFPQRSN
jgi:hypothetical protein